MVTFEFSSQHIIQFVPALFGSSENGPHFLHVNALKVCALRMFVHRIYAAQRSIREHSNCRSINVIYCSFYIDIIGSASAYPLVLSRGMEFVFF